MASKRRARFTLWHSLIGMVLLVLAEGALLHVLGNVMNARWTCILLVAFGGAVANIIVSTEVIREVKTAMHMLVLLSAVVMQFVLFFAFQYYFLVSLQAGAFTNLTSNPIELFLHSTMMFAFNPIYQPATTMARSLMLIQIYGSLVLVFFVLQNVWQFRGNGAQSRP